MSVSITVKGTNHIWKETHPIYSVWLESPALHKTTITYTPYFLRINSTFKIYKVVIVSIIAVVAAAA